MPLFTFRKMEGSEVNAYFWQLLGLLWSYLERYGWALLATAIVLYAYGPTLLDSSVHTYKRLTFDSRTAEARAREYEEARRRMLEDKQAEVILAAEKAAEEKRRKENEAALRPRAEMPASDDKPKNRRDYNPLLGDSSRASRITNSLRQNRPRGGG